MNIAWKRRPHDADLNFCRAHVVACDFFVSITATFQILYVFVAMKIGSRRILHQQRYRSSDGGVDHAAVPRVLGV